MSLKTILRGLWVWPIFVADTLVFGVLSLIVSIWSAKGARGCGHAWGKFNFLIGGIRTRVEGLENLPRDGGGVIIASNHCSASDIGAVFVGLPLDICWVTKDSLLKIPVFGWHLKRVHIPVTRGNTGSAQRLIQDGVRKIQDGAAVVIFPEGTRNRGPEKLLPFKKGTFLLAQASGRPIVPLAIVGSAKVWPPQALVPNKGVIIMRLGRPIDPSKYKTEEIGLLAEETRRAIEAMLSD
ncbi:MAG: lysophospholipid acyltransferase family protein [Thermodesulfobacteriota bacterium]